MARYANVEGMARHSTADFSGIDSLEMISRKPKTRFEGGYPASGEAEWWALRRRYEQLLFAEIRKLRASSSIPCKVNEPEADAAKWSALGNETADRDYQQFANVPMDAPDCRKNRPDWLQMQASKALGRVA